MTKLSDFRRTACVDWLDLTLTTCGRTQFRYLQAALIAAGADKRWLEPVNPSPGGVTNTFRVRFTDRLANNYAALREAIAEVSRVFPLASEPSITAIEVACDFMHKSELALRDSATISMTHRLQKSLFANGTKPRQYDPLTRKNRFMDKPGRRLNPKLNFRVGNRDDDLAWHVYWKITDKDLPVPSSERRARVEVTLQRDVLRSVGLAMLSDLDGYGFGSLAPFFRFRTPIAPDKQARGNRYKLKAIEMNRRLNDATPERGLHSFEPLGRRDRWRKLRSESSHLQADDELQRAVKNALRHLKL